MKDFIEHTTIAPFLVIRNNINNVWKSLWIIIITLGFIVSIYQSYELIKTYFSYPSILIQEERINNTLYYPAVTLCPQNIVNWEKIIRTNHSIRQTIENEKLKYQDPMIYRYYLETLLIQEINRLPAHERHDVLMKPQDWLLICFVKQIDGGTFCENITNFMITTYSPYFGLCVTINPGIKKESMFRGGYTSALFLIAEIKPELEFPYLNRDPGLTVTIHSPGSAPVIPWSRDLLVFPGESLHIGLEVLEFHRLHAPYVSNCTNDNEAISTFLHENSPYQRKETPFIYSRHECVASCYISFVAKEKNCLFPYLAINKEIELMKLKICSEEDLSGDFVDKAEEICSTDCPQSCRELIYRWTPIAMKLSPRTSFMKDALNYLAKKNVSSMEDYIFMTLNFETNSYIISRETEKFKPEDIFGAIGGNLGLWMGVTMLSAFELIQLLTQALTFFIYKVLIFIKFKKIQNEIYSTYL